MNPMTKHRVSDEAIRDALRQNHNCAGEVSAQLHVDLRRVIRIQIGRPLTGHLVPVRRLIQNLHSDADKLGSQYGPYWSEWQAAHPEPLTTPKPQPLVVHDPQAAAEVTKAREAYRRTARMVPDDREDEQIDFERVFNAVAGGIIQAQRQDDEGRGAA